MCYWFVLGNIWHTPCSKDRRTFLLCETISMLCLHLYFVGLTSFSGLKQNATEELEVCHCALIIILQPLQHVVP